MPVFKYRRVEDMPQDHWLRPGDPAIPHKIRLLWGWAGLVGPLHIPRGVHKFRSIEEMDAARDRWEQDRVDRIRAERTRK